MLVVQGISAFMTSNLKAICDAYTLSVGSLVSQHNTEPIARKRDAKTTKIQREDSAEWTVKKILLIHCFAAQVLSR